MTARMVTYRVKDGRADENTAYVHDVVADLEARAAVSEAFQRFTTTLVEDRCANTPELHRMTLVGSCSG